MNKKGFIWGLVKFFIGLSLLAGGIYLFWRYVDLNCFVEWISNFGACIK